MQYHRKSTLPFQYGCPHVREEELIRIWPYHQVTQQNNKVLSDKDSTHT